MQDKTPAATAAPETPPAPVAVGWLRRLASLVGGDSSPGDGDRAIGRQLARETVDGARATAAAAALGVLRGRHVVARRAWAEASAHLEDLNNALRASADLRETITAAFRRPAAVRAAGLEAARADVARAAAAPAPAGASALERELHRSAVAVLADVARALTEAAAAADVERRAELATATDPAGAFDQAYAARLEIQQQHIPVATRRVEVLRVAMESLAADAQAAEAGAAPMVDEVIARVLAAPRPVPLCRECSHGAGAAADGRPPLTYIGRGAADGPFCARCRPGETSSGARVYVVRTADVGAAGPSWLPFVCPDDGTPAVGLDPVIGIGGLPDTARPCEIVTVDGRQVERRVRGEIPSRPRPAGVR